MHNSIANKKYRKIGFIILKFLYNSTYLTTVECSVLRKNYYAKILNYTKKIFKIDRSLSKLNDERKNPRFYKLVYYGESI